MEGLPLPRLPNYFLKDVRDLPLSLPLKCKATSPEPQSPLYWTLKLRDTTPALVTPGPGTRQLGAAPVPQSSLTSISANLKPIYSDPSILPIETTVKAAVDILFFFKKDFKFIYF